MSRTWKDRPYNVRVRDKKEKTYIRHNHVERVCWMRNTGYDPAQCDIDEFDACKPHEEGWKGSRRSFNCYRALGAESRHGLYWRDSVPKWFRDHSWYNPERVRERDLLKDAKKLYNGDNDLEGFDFRNYQHRHQASWRWD